MRCSLLLWILVAIGVWAKTSQQESMEVALCGCIGCCKAAPPVCCPATCPKCLRPGQGRGSPDADAGPKGPYYHGLDGSIPHPGSPFEPNWVAHEYPAPPANCPGGSQCPCNGCVCCYTATVRCTQETTCISSETETFTDLTTVFQPTTLVDLTTESSTFIFTVENMVRFIETETSVVVATDSTVTITETYSSFVTVASSFTANTVPVTVSDRFTSATATFAFTTVLQVEDTASTPEFDFVPVTAQTSTASSTYGTVVIVDNALTTVSQVIGSLAGTFTRTLKATVTPTTQATIASPLVGNRVVLTEENDVTVLFSTSITATELVVLRTRTPWSTTNTLVVTPTVLDPVVSVTCTDTVTGTPTMVGKNEVRTLRPGESYDPRVVVQVFD